MFHFQGTVNDWPRAVVKLPDGALIKAVDRGDILRDAKAINPRLTTMLRHWGPGQHFGGSLEQNKQRARDFFQTFVDGTFLAQYARHTDIIQEYNEYLASSHTGQELQDRITWARAVAHVWKHEYRSRPELAHIRLALVNAPIGNDIHRAFAEIALEYDCVLSYHAYSHYIDGKRDPGDWRWHSGRWHFMEQAWGLKPDWLFGESGPYASVWDGWRSGKCQGGNAQAYVEAVRVWLRDVQQTAAYKEGRLKGFALFTTAGGQEWQAYETKQPEMDMMADMIRNEWKPGSEPVTPPPPPKEERQWSKLVYLLPQQTTPEQYDMVQQIAYPTRSEIAFSADSAFARPSNVTSHRVIVYDVASWGGKTALEAWANEHYKYTPATVVEYRDWPGFSLSPPIKAIPLHITSPWRAPRVYQGVPYEHEGIDLRAVAPDGRPVEVVAAASGIVDRRAYSEKGYGYYVRLRHETAGGTRYTWYAHLSSIDAGFQVGQRVAVGQRVGIAGSTGNSTAIHLHFNLEHVGHRAPGNFISGDWVDPTPYLF